MYPLLFLVFNLISIVYAQNITIAADPGCPLTSPCVVRTFYIAAVDVDWDYAPSGFDYLNNKALTESEAFSWTVRYTNRIGSIYKKAVYQEFTDGTFSVQKPKENHLGILGPVIRAHVGDVIKVVYKNMATYPFGMHAHGVLYSKENEAATYAGMDQAMAGTAVEPGQTHTYTWIVSERAGPGPNDGNSTLWAYHSHFADPGDIHAGLYGALIVYKPGILDPRTNLPTDVDKEFILHFLVFNENLSHYLRENILKYAPELTDRLPSNPNTPFTLGGDTWTESNMMHSINGRMFGNLDGLEMKMGDRVRWHLMGFGTELDVHTAHWHSQTVLMNGHRVDVVELFPATFKTVDGVADSVGTWLLHCHVLDHQMAGMDVLYRVTDNSTITPLSLTAPKAVKTAMDAPPAPRPPLAAPILGLSSGMKMSIDLTLLIALLTAFY